MFAYSLISLLPNIEKDPLLEWPKSTTKPELSGESTGSNEHSHSVLVGMEDSRLILPS